jgi:hypothetical protein
MSVETTHPPEHPAPHRARAPRWRQFAGVVAGPVAWAVQFNVGYGLTSYACHPGDRALAQVPPDWTATRPAALALAIVAALVSAWGAYISWGIWRAARQEKSGHLLEAGEGRTRFLGVWGVITSLGFLAAILFDAVMIVGAPACRG